MDGEKRQHDLERCDREIARCLRDCMVRVHPCEAYLGLCDWRREKALIMAEIREVVEHPSHYGGDVPHETIKCLEAWGLESDALLWNAVKYISRAGKKGQKIEDLKKAAWYLDRRIKLMEAGHAPPK